LNQKLSPAFGIGDIDSVKVGSMNTSAETAQQKKNGERKQRIKTIAGVERVPSSSTTNRKLTKHNGRLSGDAKRGRTRVWIACTLLGPLAIP